MTKDQWMRMEKYLHAPFAAVRLRCDGYDVTLERRPVSVTRYYIMVYVNGRVRPEWLTRDCEERRRFFAEHRRCALKKKDRERLRAYRQGVGPGHLKQLGFTGRELDPDRKISVYSPFWSSFKALRKHLEANNKGVSVVGPGLVDLFAGPEADGGKADGASVHAG